MVYDLAIRRIGAFSPDSSSCERKR